MYTNVNYYYCLHLVSVLEHIQACTSTAFKFDVFYFGRVIICNINSVNIVLFVVCS